MISSISHSSVSWTPLASSVDEHIDTSNDKSSTSDIVDAATVMFLLMMNGQQSHDRIAQKAVDTTSSLKAQQATKELEDFQKQIKSLSAKGFFDSIGQLVVDTLKSCVTGDFDKLDKDIKEIGDDPKFWNDLQKVAAVVAEVASAVVSGVTLGAGSASVVAVTAFVVGVVFSGAGMVEENFHVVEKLTNNPEFAKYFEIGCMVGSAVCGLTGAVANGLSAAASAGAKAALSEGAKQAAEQALKNPTVWQQLKHVAQVTSTVANIVSATAAVPSTLIAYDQAQTNIDAEKRKQQQQFLQRVIESIVERMQTEHKETNGDLKTARATIEANQDTQLTAASMLRV